MDLTVSISVLVNIVKLMTTMPSYKALNVCSDNITLTYLFGIIVFV